MHLHEHNTHPNVTERFTELVRFGCTGVVASLTHLGLLYLLTEFTPLWYLPATIAGFAVAFLVSFTLQKYWTFRERSSARMERQLMWFLLLQLAALSINAGGLYLLVELFGIWYMLGQTLLLLVVATGTYALSKGLIFKREQVAAETLHS